MAVRRYTAGKIISLVFKIIFVALVVFVFGLLIWRMFSSKVPSSMKSLTITDKTVQGYQIYLEEKELYDSDKNAYASQKGTDEAPVFAYYQEQAEITRSDDAYGYFAINQVVIIPGSNQVQVLFRYNKSTLKHVAEDFELDSVPDATEQPFDISLLITIQGGGAQTRVAPTSVTTKITTLYCYYRFVFDGVDIDPETTEGVFLDVYYKERVNYDARPYGTLCIYDYKSKNIPFKLSSSDEKALKQAAEKQN